VIEQEAEAFSTGNQPIGCAGTFNELKELIMESKSYDLTYVPKNPQFHRRPIPSKDIFGNPGLAIKQ